MNLKLPDTFQSYKPNVVFNIDSEHFIVKTAETTEELLGAFLLRNSVFYEEWTGKSSKSGLDIDKYDPKSDHLIVIQKKTKQVVGTYRLSATKFNNQFYTADFFNLNSFLNQNSHNKVEMGRACTHKSLRGSQAIHHIWLGLARYFRLTFSRYMFGTVSIVGTSLEYVATQYKTFLEKGMVDQALSISPTKKYQIPAFEDLLSKVKQDERSILKIPRLFLWYLSLGVKIHGLPVYDPEFGSYDFFITLDFKNIGNLKLVNRYEDAIYLKNKLPCT